MRELLETERLKELLPIKRSSEEGNSFIISIPLINESKLKSFKVNKNTHLIFVEQLVIHIKVCYKNVIRVTVKQKIGNLHRWYGFLLQIICLIKKKM